MTNLLIVAHIKDQVLCRSILLLAGTLEAFDQSLHPGPEYNGRGCIFKYNERVVYAKLTPITGYELFVFPEGTTDEQVRDFVADDLKSAQKVSLPREVPYNDHSLN